MREEAAFYLHMTDALPVWVCACSYMPLVLCMHTCVFVGSDEKDVE